MNKNKENIVLIGMPAVGKSTIGVILAKILGYDFIDTDLLIQADQEKLLKDIIEQVGIKRFLEIENRVNASVNVTRSVIATGGSAVYGKPAMEHFKRIGTVVYLQADFKVLEKRLSDIKGRGVVCREDQTLYDLFVERDTLYRKYADLILPEHGGIEDTVAELQKMLTEYESSQEKETDSKDSLFDVPNTKRSYKNRNANKPIMDVVVAVTHSNNADCPSCGEEFDAVNDKIDGEIQCPFCGQRVKVDLWYD